MQVARSSDDGIDIVYDIVNALIVGNKRWPCATRALKDLKSFIADLPADDRSWLIGNAQKLAGLSGSELQEALRALERQEPDSFRSFLNALYGAYYTSAAVSACIRNIATAGPTEPPHFDAALLEKVIQTQAGKRRL